MFRKQILLVVVLGVLLWIVRDTQAEGFILRNVIIPEDDGAYIYPPADPELYEGAPRFFIYPDPEDQKTNFKYTFTLSSLGARLFIVPYKSTFDLNSIMSGAYTEITLDGTYRFSTNKFKEYYLGIYTGVSRPRYTDDGFKYYTDPCYGWCKFSNNNGIITVKEGGILSYKSGGIIIGTETLLPVPVIPAIEISSTVIEKGKTILTITYTGTLQWSRDMKKWEDVEDATTGTEETYTVDTSLNAMRFYRVKE